MNFEKPDQQKEEPATRKFRPALAAPYDGARSEEAVHLLGALEQIIIAQTHAVTLTWSPAASVTVSYSAHRKASQQIKFADGT